MPSTTSTSKISSTRMSTPTNQEKVRKEGRGFGKIHADTEQQHPLHAEQHNQFGGAELYTKQRKPHVEQHELFTEQRKLYIELRKPYAEQHEPYAEQRGPYAKQ
ncbi:hypothetical protein U1Q18_021468 [Sarracenia purpurea var. burkii]